MLLLQLPNNVMTEYGPNIERLRQDIINCQTYKRIGILQDNIVDKIEPFLKEYEGKLTGQLPEGFTNIVKLSVNFHGIAMSTISKSELEMKLDPEVEEVVSQINEKIDEIAKNILEENPNK